MGEYEKASEQDGDQVSGQATTGGAEAGTAARPARGYSWPPFEKGNTVGLKPGHTLSTVHGAYSERQIAPRAEEFATSLLEDAATPAHVRSPAFAYAVRAWARAEAAAALMFDWICELDMNRLTEPRKTPGKAPIELWRSLEAHAATLRARLGLDPVSYGRLARDLGIARREGEEALSQLGETGRAIREKRAAELQAGGADAQSA